MLEELNLNAVYDSSEYDLVKDLFIPLLRESIRYDRGVGFFSSGWLKQASKGLIEIGNNSGKIRMVISPIISETDWEAMKKGNEAKQNEIVYKTLLESIENLESTLENSPLNALAWLIADDLLTIKFAVPKGKLDGGDFHDKFGIFEDEVGNKVAIHGSYKDTVHGSLNGESFSVFKSWEQGQIEYVEKHDKRFSSLFNDSNPMFKIYEIPDALKSKIIKFRKFDRPYGKNKSRSEKPKPKFPKERIVLRKYQNEALNSWIKSEYKGVFEMATGTGKTITSLACAHSIYKRENRLALIVCVPFLHLIPQWEEEMKKFGFNPIPCSSQNPNWHNKFKLKIQDYNLRFRDKLSCIITHSSAATDKFQTLLHQIKTEPKMTIYDEVHSLGSLRLKNALSNNIDLRIGLSATPQRWFDSAGTNLLMNYFKGVCFSYPLEKAIGKYLSEYKYIPHIVELNQEEFYKYSKLSSQIGKIYHSDEFPEENPYLASLLRERKKLINNAAQKNLLLKSIIIDVLKTFKEKKKVFSHALFYCPVGGHLEVLKILAEIGIKAREFIYKVDLNERKIILKQFSEGDIQALVAIKCLDEGVDVPSTKHAFVLASTTNPREFIQRRGRILRKHKGKKEAIIHDFIVFPPLDKQKHYDMNEEHMLSIMRREIPRFAEFAASASNEFEARNTVREILGEFNAEYLLDMKPWDIYSNNSIENLDLDELED